jgi:hypothetical protein
MPNFSGLWEFDRERPRLGLAALRDLETLTVTIVQPAGTLHLQRFMLLGGRFNESQFSVLMDGAEHRLPDRTRQLFADATWAGDALTIRTRVIVERGERA